MAQPRNIWHGFFECLAIQLNCSHEQLIWEVVLSECKDLATITGTPQHLHVDIAFGKILIIQERIDFITLRTHFETWKKK